MGDTLQEEIVGGAEAVVPAEAREPRPVGDTATVAAAAPRRTLWRLDLLACVLLFLAAFPVRWAASTGDFWLDEADYAFASVRGLQANRWDRVERGDPERLLRLRHYHPPLVAYAIGAARHWGEDDRMLRVPFILAGCLTVSLLYLCGVTLYGAQARKASMSPDAPRAVYTPRVAAAVCAMALIVTPAHVRASSHALPWAFITLWLVALVWTLAQHAETRRAGWLVGVFAALGGMFVTSEYFFPAALAAVCATPFLTWGGLGERAIRKKAAVGLGLGVGLFLLIAWALWPAGLTGGALKMLRHYMGMADALWPVEVRGQVYDRAPKWAYAAWYWDEYRPYVLFYAAGAVAALVLAARLRLTRAAGVTVVVTTLVLAVAHKSHIIGPEYLVHGLTLLTLVGGLAVQALLNAWVWIGLLGAAAATVGVLHHTPQRSLNGMDARSRLPRWEQAARFLAPRWSRHDRALAPSYGGVGRWYLLHVANIPAKEWQVQALPSGDASPSLIRDLATGVYRYVIVGSTFSDWQRVDPTVQQIVKKWPVVWKSGEGGTGPSRLRIYQLPRGVDRFHPLPVPGGTIAPNTPFNTDRLEVHDLPI